VAAKELLARKGKLSTTSSQEALIRKTASVPNMANMAFFNSPVSGSSTKLEKSDSSFDLSYITNTAYEGFDRIRQKANSILGGSTTTTTTAAIPQTDGQRPLSSSTPASKATTPSDTLPPVRNPSAGLYKL
jgi:hypothetical protein